jgi:hypothetical protein
MRDLLLTGPKNRLRAKTLYSRSKLYPLPTRVAIQFRRIVIVPDMGKTPELTGEDVVPVRKPFFNSP